MDIIINDGKVPLTKEDVVPVVMAIKAFEEGEEQAEGRFEILERL